MFAVDDYENDCFVSYSHLDNVPFGDPPRPGWVAIFHQHLQGAVAFHVGRQIRVWRDARLTGAEVFSEQIEAQLRRSAVLISVISPSYLQSSWCSRELLGFVQFADQSSSLRFGTLKRVVKVLRLPIEQSALPAVLGDTLGAQFYSVDPQSKRARDLLLEPTGDKAFLARVDDVAQDVKRLLDAMTAAAPAVAAADVAAEAVAAPPAASAQAVFLAWTTSDLVEMRERMRRDLQARGYRVVPVGEPPLHVAGIQAAVLEALRDAIVSVHLIGAHDGFVPEGGLRSVIELQGDHATYRQAGSRAARIFWLSDADAPRDVRLAEMIERTQAVAEPGPGFDVMERKSIEDLKTLVLHRLSMPRVALPPAPKSSRLVYLLCDQLDRAAVASLRHHLFAAGLEVRLPLFEGDVAELRDEHEGLLNECNGVLLYWGAAKEAWLRKMLRDMSHVFGGAAAPRVRPYAATCLYVAGPATDAKQDFLTHEVSVVREHGAFVPDALHGFVDRLTGA